MNALRVLLNRLRWDPGTDGSNVELLVRSRCDGEARLVRVAFEEVTAVLAGGVGLVDGTFLPYHRVVAVMRGREQLWTARTGA